VYQNTLVMKPLVYIVFYTFLLFSKVRADSTTISPEQGPAFSKEVQSSTVISSSSTPDSKSTPPPSSIESDLPFISSDQVPFTKEQIQADYAASPELAKQELQADINKMSPAQIEKRRKTMQARFGGKKSRYHMHPLD
jgi:hypothetical protein